MRGLLTVSILLSFIFISVIGLLFVDSHFGGHGCFVSSAYRNACLMDSAMALALFHVNFFKSFSQTLVPLLAALILIVLVIGLGLFSFILGREFLAEKRLISFFRKPFLPLQYRFLDWFSVLRENFAA